MTNRHRAVAALFALEALAFGALGLVLLDRRLHQRDAAFGVNQWGYRDEARGAKEAGEIRVALVGGSAAFEAGVGVSRTLAGRLFFELRDAGAPSGQVYSVVNLAEPRVGAGAYAQTLRDYAFLAPDVVVLFDGYDAREGLPPHARRRSAAFRATGYLPILPARLLGRPAWMSDADGGVVSIDRDDAAYGALMADAVRAALQLARAVIVAAPPTVSARHAAQQRSLRDALALSFSRESRVVFMDLGSAIDLGSRVFSPDGVHRTEAGNHELAQRIAREVLTLTRSR